MEVMWARWEALRDGLAREVAQAAQRGTEVQRLMLGLAKMEAEAQGDNRDRLKVGS